MFHMMLSSIFFVVVLVSVVSSRGGLSSKNILATLLKSSMQVSAQIEASAGTSEKDVSDCKNIAKDA